MKCPECQEKLKLQDSVKSSGVVVGETYLCVNPDCVVDSLDINYSEIMQIKEKKGGGA